MRIKGCSIAVIAAVLAGCGGGSSSNVESPTAASAPAPSATSPGAAATPVAGPVPPSSAPLAGTPGGTAPPASSPATNPPAAPPPVVPAPVPSPAVLSPPASAVAPAVAPESAASAPSYAQEPGCLSYFVTPLTSSSGIDPLLPAQWHLQNTGQLGGLAGEDLRVLSAWNTTRGQGARVAVIDDAIETLHPDLAPNVLAGSSYNYRAGPNKASVYPLPCTIDEDHGTAVAGLIVARDANGIGGAGVAPRASLTGLNALASNSDADIAGALQREAQSIGVYSNSWGSPDDGKLHAVSASFKTAIANGIANGRSGRGSVYVFAAGNGGCFVGDLLSDGRCNGWSDNANFDGYLTGLGVIPVCAVSNLGTKSWYDEAGANTLVCGLSGNRSANVTTTDLVARAGGTGYRSEFSGTSASTPMVSGVVALMLAARPELSWRDVRLILAQTARKNDAQNTGWSSNFGFNYHRSYAFGVVDAQAAVARALTWVSVGGSTTLKSCGPFAKAAILPIADATGAVSPTTPGPTVEDTITISAAACDIAQIEFVEIRFAATHTASGDLRIRLQSPNGLVSELANARVCQGSCGDYGDASGANPWTFGSVRHLGEPVAGAWRLQVTDMIPIDVGSLRNWSLRFWGR